MPIDITHARNPVIGWDITVKATAKDQQKFSFATVTVNGFPVFDDPLDNLSAWNMSFTQQGEFPGDNTVKVDITNDAGDVESAEDSWE
jgi:hypothetical protein